MPTTVKISQLPSASSGDITVSSDVLPIIDGSTTKQITVENLLIAAGTAISGNLLPFVEIGDVTSSFDLGSPTAVWQDLYISTASINFVDKDGAITKFTKKDVADLKEGKSLRKGDQKQVVNELDDTTYVRMGQTGKAWHYASNVPLIQLQTSSFDLGTTDVPMTLEGSTLMMTGSINTTGSFNVNDLLNLLANFGQTGIPTGSGEGGISVGDINLDGQVNVNDLLLVLGGYGNPNCIIEDTIIPPNVNHQMVGPEICISQSITLSIGTNSNFGIT